MNIFKGDVLLRPPRFKKKRKDFIFRTSHEFAAQPDPGTLERWNPAAAGLQSWVTLQGSTGRVWKGSSMVRSGLFPSNRWFQCLLLEPAKNGFEDI